MILIRGIKGEKYARKIEQGIVDCRDALSALLEPPVTGYAFSDYYEKNLVKALTYTADGVENLHDVKFLHSLLSDSYIPHIYLTYFHVLNEHSLEWLDNFDDDYSFIAVDIQIDRNTKAAIGNEFFGARMTYVDSIRQLNQDSATSIYTACMCSMEHLFPNKPEMNFPLQIYGTLAFALLCREQDEKYTDIENEFRVIAYDCPRIQNGVRVQKEREVTLYGKTGVRYSGMLKAGTDSVLRSNLCLLKCPEKPLSDILNEEHGMVTMDSQFKSIRIGEIANCCWFLGGKQACAEYIKKMNQRTQKEKYIQRTVRRVRNLKDIPDAVFAPSHIHIEY